jgi:hypothetical protein
MSSLSLSQRLQALADSYKETLKLIHELRQFSPSSYTDQSDGDPDERRVELATEIHDNLREQEDTLETLRQQFEDGFVAPNHRRDLPRRGGGAGPNEDRERNADLLDRLTEDLKTARASFRRAQLTAKRNADSERRKEREQLFAADRKGPGPTRPPTSHEKLTQDELALRAADDVTLALRRVHNQLESELARSQFAQQTLDESQQALESLAQSYTGMTDLLKASRSFVGQLVRSTKSDTWFLKSSFYLLAVTIAWLFYRRILYGPLMLLVWWPLRTMWWVTMTSLGAAGLGVRPDVASAPVPKPTLSVSMPGMNARGMPTHQSNIQFKSMPLPAKGGGWNNREPEQQPEEYGDSMVEEIGRMTEGNDHVVDIDHLSPEERKAQEEQPRNTKKRMMEVDVESPGPSRDEL